VVAGLVDPPLMPQKFAPIKDSKPEVASLVRARLDRLIAGEDIRPTPAAELLASLPFEERSALIPEEPLQSLQKRLATTWPGGSLTLVRRARVSDASPAEQEMSVYRLAKDNAALLILFMPGTQGSTSAFGVMGDRPYE